MRARARLRSVTVGGPCAASSSARRAPPLAPAARARSARAMPSNTVGNGRSAPARRASRAAAGVTRKTVLQPGQRVNFSSAIAVRDQRAFGGARARAREQRPSRPRPTARRDVNHGAYAAATLVRLRREDAGQHDARRRARTRAASAGASSAQRIGEDVGDDDVERAAHAGRPSGARTSRVDAVGRALARAGAHRLRIDVDADDAARAELRRRDREDAGAAAVVEHRRAGAKLAREPGEAKPRRRMRPGAEREPRIERAG